MKLKDTYVCIDCEEVYDKLRALCVGNKDVTVCPSCTSKSGILLSRWVKTMAEHEIEEARKEVCCG
jgi:NAD-dependent SIR2 family protein deacetylase